MTNFYDRLSCWYYQKDDTVIGPIRPQEIYDLLADKSINTDTLVISEGMTQWVKLADSVFFSDEAYRKTANEWEPTVSGIDHDIKCDYDKFHFEFMMTLWGLIGGMVMLYVWLILTEFEFARGLSSLLLWTGCLILTAGLGYFILFIYRCWIDISPSHRMAKPLGIVALMLTPGISIFWSFYAVYVLSKRIRKKLSFFDGRSASRKSEYVGLFLCFYNLLFWAFVFIPHMPVMFYNSVLGIFILIIWWVRETKEAMERLLELNALEVRSDK